MKITMNQRKPSKHTIFKNIFKSIFENNSYYINSDILYENNYTPTNIFKGIREKIKKINK